MTASALAQLAVDALRLTLAVAGPAVLACLAVGLLVGMFQAASAANDASVSFVPKLFVVAAVLFASRAYMSEELVRFGAKVFQQVAQIGIGSP